MSALCQKRTFWNAAETGTIRSPRRRGEAVIVALTRRRFLPPWTVEDIGAAFVVTDSAGQKLSYIYYEEEPGRRSAAKLLSKDEARRIAVNVA